MTATCVHNLGEYGPSRRGQECLRARRTATDRVVRPATPRAFTLIELVLVMFLLCIIGGVVMPSLRGFLTSSASRDAATQVVALAEYARARAAQDALAYRMSFDEASGEYWLSVDAGDGSGEFAALGDDFGQVFSLPRGMTVAVARSAGAMTSRSSASSDIDFRPDGTSDAAVIRLTDADGYETLIAAPAPTEPLRVVTAEEASEL